MAVGGGQLYIWQHIRCILEGLRRSHGKLRSAVVSAVTTCERRIFVVYER